MIFLSHNHKDKPVVEQIAARLAEIYSTEKVFYDSWSIQPGDGIIDKMNSALEQCDAFLFFVSKNSLQSNMVKLEWQNAIIKQTHGKAKLIPVKLDDCMMPAILLQTLYIDLFGQGLEVALRQICDVLAGKNTFTGPQQFSNLRGYIFWQENALTVECHAAHFMEPVTSFVFLSTNEENEITYKCVTSELTFEGFKADVKMNDGNTYKGEKIAIQSATVPGFPFVIKMIPNPGVTINFAGILHEKSKNNWVGIPWSIGRPPSIA
jgi:hypothetical protein